MIAKNLLALSLAAAASVATPSAHALGPIKLFHFHPTAATQPDSRVAFTLVNHNVCFRDLKVDGHVYTVMPGHSLNITAPAGTLIYADSQVPLHRRGDVLLEVAARMNNSVINLL